MASPKRAHEPVEVDYPPLPPPRIVERVRAFCQEAELARGWEAWRPVTLGFLAAIVAAQAGLPHTSVAAIVAKVLPLVFIAMAVLTAQVVTTQSVLLGVADRPVLARLRASGHYHTLIKYFREAGRSMACFLIVAVSLFVLDACGLRLPWHDRAVPATLAGSFTWACLNGFRMNRLMFKLLLHKDAAPPAT